jgi:adenine-specific DNA-methyltransferase
MQKHNMYFNIENRRYIGSKIKLTSWIMDLIDNKCSGDVFADIFAGTAIVASAASKKFKHIIVNDFLYSNNVIYNGFFLSGKYDMDMLDALVNRFNDIDSDKLEENYFSQNFGGKYFSFAAAKKIGYIRTRIEKMKVKLSKKEYYILLSSLIYSVDRIANTVGHYDAYFKGKKIAHEYFQMKLIKSSPLKSVDIYREDSNDLVKKLRTDIVYIDPPYNSRQYSRFYHLLENLVKWEKPKLYGVALKPETENVSSYCKVSAKSSFEMLINDIKAKYIVVSYNNTYKSKSNSSKNKITLEEIKEILDKKGNTEIFDKRHNYFNAGKTNFDNHKEFLFITKV